MKGGWKNWVGVIFPEVPGDQLPPFEQQMFTSPQTWGKIAYCIEVNLTKYCIRLLIYKYKVLVSRIFYFTGPLGNDSNMS